MGYQLRTKLPKILDPTRRKLGRTKFENTISSTRTIGLAQQPREAQELAQRRFTTQLLGQTFDFFKIWSDKFFLNCCQLLGQTFLRSRTRGRQRPTSTPPTRAGTPGSHRPTSTPPRTPELTHTCTLQRVDVHSRGLS